MAVIPKSVLKVLKYQKEKKYLMHKVDIFVWSYTE